MIGILIVFILTVECFSLTVKEVKILKKMSVSQQCPIKEFNELKGTPLEEPARAILVEKCSGEFLKRILPPDSPYYRFLYAKKVFPYAPIRAVMELKSVFLETETFDEDIILFLNGEYNFLIDQDTLSLKLKRLLKKRKLEDFKEYYSLSNQENPLLLGIYYLRTGKKEKSVEELLKSKSPKRFFYLVFAYKDPEDKVKACKKLLKSKVDFKLKRFALIYLLDYLLLKERRKLFLELLEEAKEFSREIYLKSKARFLARFYDLEKVYEFLKKERPDLPLTKILSVKLKKERLDLKKLKTGNLFYNLLLGFEPNLSVKKTKFSPEKAIKKYGLCPIVEETASSPELAKALYECGNYYKAIKLMAKYGIKDPLKVYYPLPEVFEKDIALASVGRQESLFNPNAVSRSGAIGLMQIMPRTGAYLSTLAGIKNFSSGMLFNQELNVFLSRVYFEKLMKEFDNNFFLAISAYNCGPSRIKKALEKYGEEVKTPIDVIIFTELFLPFEETRNYVKRITVNLFYYSKIYKGRAWKSLINTLNPWDYQKKRGKPTKGRSEFSKFTLKLKEKQKKTLEKTH